MRSARALVGYGHGGHTGVHALFHAGSLAGRTVARRLVKTEADVDMGMRSPPIAPSRRAGLEPRHDESHDRWVPRRDGDV